MAEDEAGEGSYLIIQCAVAPPTAQDTATGLDSYCVMDEQGAVQYGGIRRVDLTGQTLNFQFTDQAAEELDLTRPELELHLDVPEIEIRTLTDGLQRILTFGNPNQHPETTGLVRRPR